MAAKQPRGAHWNGASSFEGQAASFPHMQRQAVPLTLKQQVAAQSARQFKRTIILHQKNCMRALYPQLQCLCVRPRQAGRLKQEAFRLRYFLALPCCTHASFLYQGQWLRAFSTCICYGSTGPGAHLSLEFTIFAPHQCRATLGSRALCVCFLFLIRDQPGSDDRHSPEASVINPQVVLRFST